MLIFFSFQPVEIQPLDYDPDCPFPYNNFVYHVKLISEPRATIGTTRTIRQARQPGTVPLPINVSSLVIRLSNKAAGLNDLNRVQNEVAIMSLMRDALKTLPTQLVPAVYGWASAASQQGWILQQYMPGSTLDAEFSKMDLEGKESVLQQMAEILLKLQHYQLPDTIQEFGGLSFDESGDVISGPVTIFQGGPFSTYEDEYREMLRLRLATADKNSLVQGWRSRGIRERLECFLAQGLGRIMQGVDYKKVLIHGDFTTNNLLVDGKTQRLTAILDFDWAQVSGVAEEFLHSLGDVYGKVPGPYSNDSDQLALRQAVLHGFPDPLPSSKSESGVDWGIAGAWDTALACSGAQRPRTIMGIAALSELKWLSDKVCPFLLFNETVVAQRNKEQQVKDKEDTEGFLISFLDAHGY
ncbi:MAG: hypothetical protein M1817_003097 [Caeruleum heppii]|nr:MAG: hypothetical protein M1817_003097 [Caeruleum heppii]